MGHGSVDFQKLFWDKARADQIARRFEPLLADCRRRRREAILRVSRMMREGGKD